MRWTIDAARAGTRLDLFLAGMRPEFTRSSIQKVIKAGTVTVNGREAAVHRFLKPGDVVEWKDDVGAGLVSTRATTRVAPTTIQKPRIVAETDDWLVIDKPAGLLVHPDAKTKTGTLIDWLLAHDPTIGKVGEDPVRPGIVHRLDREVSGLMVVAKSQRAYDDLKRQFAERKVEKRYLALVYGRVMKDEGDIKLRIARSTSQARMAARPAHEAEGRAAWTHYRVRERLRGATLLDLEILSGRTHQIRAHLQAIGHPVVGDALYAPKKIPPRPVASRLMLQSVSLAFDDPASGERRSYSIPPDPAFRELR